MSPSHMKAQRMMGNMVKSVLPLLFRASTGTPFVFQTASPNKTVVTAIIKALLSHISLSPQQTSLSFRHTLTSHKAAWSLKGALKVCLEPPLILPPSTIVPSTG